MAAHDQEELLNGKLAELLAGQGLEARAERREGGRRMDVVVDVGGARVVLEAETGFSAAKRREAIGDADRRLKQGLTTVVFAVCYPDGSTTDSLAQAKPIWTVRTRSELGDDAGRARWSEPGGVPELAEAIRQAGGAVGDADGAAQILSEALDAAVRRLSTPTREMIARALDLPREKRSDRRLLELHQRETDGYFIATKRGMLVVATAMLFHHRLQEHLPLEPPTDFSGVWPPANPTQCAARPETTIGAFLESWRAIIEVDYRPVFEVACVVLETLSISPDVAQALFVLASDVAKIAGLIHGLRHDLLGRIFHRVLDTARYDGSFYTSTAAAVLLAALAIREEDRDWSDPKSIGQLRVCDPACGTGTLLMAAAERIRDLRQRTGPVAEEDERLLSLALVENVLWGYDINLTATHMAASTLGMLSPSTQFNNINVHRTLLGVHDGVAYVGSPELLQGQLRLRPWPSISQQIDERPEENGVNGAKAPPPMDVVVMNPPFTRDSLRHDQFSKDDEAAIKRQEKDLLKDQPHRGAARLHSSGGMFTVLSEKMLKPDHGVIALVLPAVVPTAPGNRALREYLATRLHVETIVSSHDPSRILMSENTKISEVLLIGRRWTGDQPKPPTRVVNLIENPSTPVAAVSTAAQIQRGQGRFVVQQVDAERIAAGDWYSVNFLSPFLAAESAKMYESLSDTAGVYASLASLAHIEPAGQRIRDAYRRSDVPTVADRRALWFHKADVTQSMQAHTDTFIDAKDEKRHLADRYWGMRSEFLLGARLRLNTARAAAVIVEQPAVGSLWVPCRPKDGSGQTSRAFCIYLNSTVGLLSLLARRAHNVLSRPAFSLDTLRSIPVPNFAVLGDDARDGLAAAFELLKDEVLLPFPQMNEDPIRKRLDDAVTDALGLDPEWVAQIRRALAEEPSITNRRYAGLDAAGAG